MRKSVLRRGGAAAMFLAGIGAVIFAFSPGAQAATVLYQNNNANVRVTGDEAVAMNKCINDAKDGVIQTQINACQQISTAGNIVELENVSIYVQATTFPHYLLYQAGGVNVEVSGGPVAAVNLCVNDAQDGFIQTQQNACVQAATAGNIVNLTGVWVTVYSAS